MGRAFALVCPAAVLNAALGLPAPAAHAQPADLPAQPASWRLMLSDLTVLRLNPLGLETRGRFGFQKRLFPSKAKISENNFAFFGLYP
jgi:hypothetical protein